MAIPLVGSPAPTVVTIYEDILTGDSRDFLTTVGNWTATGGTLTRDTDSDYRLGSGSASLKWVTTAQNQYISCPIPGVFRAGRTYDVLLYQKTVLNQSTPYGSGRWDFGLYGTDVANTDGSWSKDYYDGPYCAVLLRWAPTANRSGVTLRLTRNAAETGTTEWRIGHVRVARIIPGSPGLALSTLPGEPSISLTNVGTFGGRWINLKVSPDAVGYLGVGLKGAEIGDNEDAYVGVYSRTNDAGEPVSETWMSGGYHSGDMIGEGVWIGVGPDYLGLQIGEKDESTVQIYPEYTTGYDIELVDRGAGRHWRLRGTDASRSVVLANAIENPMQAEDDLVVGDSHAYAVVGSNSVVRWLSYGVSDGEMPVTGSDVQVEWPLSGSVTIDWDMWVGHYGFTTVSSMTTELRLRRKTVGVADPDRFVIVSNGTMKVGAYTLTATTMPEANTARRVTITHASVGDTDILGYLVIVGTDIGGGALTENLWLRGDFTLSDSFFKTVSSITGSNWTIDGGADTVTVGCGDEVLGEQLGATDTWTANAPVYTGVAKTHAHYHQWTGQHVDASPTDGHYILTARIAAYAGTSGYLLSDYWTMALSGTGLGKAKRLPKGTDGQILAVDPATHHLAWKNPEQAHFQWPFYVPGTLAIGTDKAVYFQVPDTCAIDEVRVHVGTAPTGTSLIVDVNDDGTTIFTTQGNRPEVAISGTDDTSGVPDGGTSVAKDSVLTIDLDQVGSTIAGADLVVFVRGHYIW